MLKAWKEKRARLKLQAECNHRWELFDMIPPEVRDGFEDEFDVYIIRCPHCKKQERRDYFSIQGLHAIGRLQTMKGEGVV